MSQKKSIENSPAGSTPSPDPNVMRNFQRKVYDFEDSIQQVLDHLRRLDVRLSTMEKSLTSFNAEVPLGPAKKDTPKETKPAPDYEEVEDVHVLAGSDSDEDVDPTPTQATVEVCRALVAVYDPHQAPSEPALRAKSNVVFDVKPWSFETDLKVMEAAVRKIAADGLVWGEAKLVPFAYGIEKLQISCVFEDEKISMDWLLDQLESIEQHVQTVDIDSYSTTYY